MAGDRGIRRVSRRERTHHTWNDQRTGERFHRL